MSVSIGAIQRIFNNLISILNSTIDGFTIGSITPEPATFTTLTATTSNLGTISTGTVGGAAVINNGTVYSNTTTAYVSTTTLAPISGLVVNSMVAGGTYAVAGQIPLSGVGNAQGIKAALVGTNSLTLTTASVIGTLFNGSTVAAQTMVTALSSDMANFANTATLLQFEGTVVVNAAGSLGLQAAQHSSSATTSTVSAGGYLQVTRIS